jgi:hypothetical protein
MRRTGKDAFEAMPAAAEGVSLAAQNSGPHTFMGC